jgi:phospholipid transport system substrate-binding protein
MFRIKAAVTFLAFAFATNTAIAACPSENLVMGAGKAFTAASRSGSASAFSSAASRYANMRGIALSALGPHRKKLSKAQEGEYVRLAQSFMGQFMSQNAGRFNTSGMKIVSCSSNLVTASAAGGRKIMFRVSGGRVQDVNVSSVWLAGQMRSTFVGVLNRNNGDINALLRYIRERT